MRYLNFSIFILISSLSIAQLKPEPGCSSEKAFGDISICLPNFSGMTECYSDPRVKKHVDQTRYEGNEIIAMYFTDATYSRADELGEFSYDNYYKVYAPFELKNLPVTKSDVDQMVEIMEGVYNKESWEEMKKEIEKDFEYFSLEQPVLINTLETNSNLRNMVFLMSVVSDYETVDLVMTINIVHLKNRMIFFAYYKRFSGESSIDFATKQSQIFGGTLIEANE